MQRELSVTWPFSLLRVSCAFLGGLILAAPAATAELSGYVSAEARLFEHSPAQALQKEGAGASAIFAPTFYHSWREGRTSFEATPYLRIDSVDPERDLFDLREFSLLFVRGDWETRIGVSKVFWGVAESQHLVDTINQTDLVANPDGEEKLGQPMAQIVYVSPVGDFGLFLLPGFRERTFPGERGRFRGGLPVEVERPLFESSGGTERLDLALRWKRYIGALDIGLHYFRGTNREPLLALERDEAGEVVLRPYYELMDQVGVDAQLTVGGWLWKLEALARDGSSDRFAALVGGFEYTLYGIRGAFDLGLLAEAHLDSRGRHAPTVFNRDLFLGARLVWNDEADTSLLGGIFVDADTGSAFGRLEFERRLGKASKLEIELQRLSEVTRSDPLFPLKRDSYLQVALSRYF